MSEVVPFNFILSLICTLNCMSVESPNAEGEEDGEEFNEDEGGEGEGEGEGESEGEEEAEMTTEEAATTTAGPKWARSGVGLDSDKLFG